MSFLSNWAQLFTIFFLSILKFGIGLFTAINSSIGVLPSVLANLFGGAIGILIFIHFGYWIKKKYYEIRYKNKVYYRFSGWNKFLVNLKKRVGLTGISFLSPIILTIPVGVMMALQITENKRKIFVFMFSSMVLWSAIFFILKRFFDISILN